MTDNEIIEALECCTEMPGRGTCQECPLRNRDGSCTTHLARLALDLINRKNAEIDRLTFEYAGFKAEVKHFVDLNKMVKTKAIKEFAERVKEKAWKGMWEILPHVDIDDIDAIVKEMTEETQ